MPYITNEPLCHFCKYFRLEESSITTKRCDAFPDGIPIELCASDMTFDHREPYTGDNGIQFEFLNDRDEMRLRLSRYAEEGFWEIVLRRYEATIEKIEMGRRGGWIEPSHENIED